MSQSVKVFSWYARPEEPTETPALRRSTRCWEHNTGKWLADCHLPRVEERNVLGLAVGLESFSHWVVQQAWSKQVTLTDAWGNAGWRGECSPADCIETRILWEKAERTPWCAPWLVWELKVVSRYLDLATKWDVPSNSMDFVYSFSSLEHINQKVSGEVDDAAIVFALSEAVRVLAPGGVFITTNPFDVVGHRWGSLLDWKRRFTEAGFEVTRFPHPEIDIHLDPEPRFGGWHGTFVFMARKDRA